MTHDLSQTDAPPSRRDDDGAAFHGPPGGAAMPGRGARAERVVFAAIVAFGLLARLVVAFTMTPWQSPDEPKHFEYVRLLVDQRATFWAERRLPTMDDADPALQAEIIASVARSGYWSSINQRTPDPLPTRFEDVWLEGAHTQLHRPSLYYYLAAPVLLPFKQAPLETQVVIVRLVSVVLSTATIWVVALVARSLTPADPFVPLVSSAFVATLPMHVYIGGAVNNDNLVTLLGSVSLLAVVGSLRDGFRLSVWGAVLAAFVLGLATKRTVVGLAPAVGLTGLFWLCTLRGRRLVLAVAVIGVVILLLLDALGPRFVTGWLPVERLRGAVTAYALNFPDHLRALLAVPITAPEVWALIGRHQYLFLLSFWGMFGWFSRPLPLGLFDVLMYATGVGAAGFLLWLVGRGVAAFRPEADAARRSLRIGLVCLTAIVSMVVLAEGERLAYLKPGYVPQGRYLFSVVAAIALALAVGLRTLLPARFCGTTLPVVLVVCGLVVLDVYVYGAVLLPFFQATAHTPR